MTDRTGPDGPLRLGFTTYAMREADPFEAVGRLRDVGYDAVEFAAADGWPTSHDRLGPTDRERFVDRLRDLGFPPAHVSDLSVAPLSPDRPGLERFEATCALASDLNFGDDPAVVKATGGGEPGDWEERDDIADVMTEYAEVAAAHDAMFAVEPHVGQAVDTPEKAARLMEIADHPGLALTFDVSHFPPAQFDTERAVDLCAPHAVTTHVKDTEVADDGSFQFRLPGATGFDYGSFLRLLVDRGYAGPITAEVSVQVWDEPGYDPWETARRCYVSLRGAVASANRYALERGE